MKSKIEDRAVRFVEGVLLNARDWQEGEHALADHPEFGPWLNDVYGDDAISEAQDIIRRAEDRLGDRLPY